MKKEASSEFVLKLVMAILFLSGAVIFLYPFIVDSLNNSIDQQRINQYQKESQANQKEQAQKLAELQEKNIESSKTSVPGLGVVADPFEATIGNLEVPDRSYLTKHTLGAIYIPAINVSLPIFDETNDILLQKGATLLQGTSYPIGGSGSHAVITGHTGLAEKKLFTDLEHLPKGALFFIDVLGERLAYKVIRIKKVLPTEVSDLQIVESEDLVTLLTCTPYGVNSHRLLVTASRTPYIAEMDQEIQQAQNYHHYRLVLIIVGMLIFLTLFSFWVWRKIVLYGSTRRKYNLCFFVKPNCRKVFLLTDRKGKIIKELSARQRANQQGVVIFKGIPGGKYWVALQGEKQNQLLLKAKINGLKDAEFTLKGKPKTNLLVKKGAPNKYYLKKAALKQAKFKVPRAQFFKHLGISMIFFIGSLVTLYPFYSDAVNSLIDQTRLARYQSELMNEQERLSVLAKENQQLLSEGNNPDGDPFTDGESGANKSYRQHLIGAVIIPKIAVEVPLFNVTNDSLLDIGANVLKGSSQPTGGNNTHSVISAHRGLPQKQLFTDLPELIEGDTFILNVLGEKLAYEVDQIRTVLPDEIEDLKIIPGEDLVTLLTCTPYMINSHRLLVRGHRVPYTEELAAEIAMANQIRQINDYALLALLMILVSLFVYVLWRGWRNYRLSQQSTDLIFFIQNSQEYPIEQQNFQLFNKNGKQPVMRGKHLVTSQSNSQGKVIFKDLPKAEYQIKNLDWQDFCLKAGYQKLNQTTPNFKLKNYGKQYELRKIRKKVIVRLNRNK